MTAPPSGITITHGFTEAERAQVALLYWDAFGQKLGRALGPNGLALNFLTDAVDPGHALCARGEGGELLGVAGFKTPMGGLISGGMQPMAQAYGWVGAMWRSALLAALGSDIDNQRFLIDGLFVAPHARGRGIGTALIYALVTEGTRRGYRELRLEVIDENIRARALYERHGFAAIHRQPTGWLRWIFGFRAAITMVRPLP